MTTTPIVQIGTSRFLQAHAALFVSDALQAGTALGPITVVQSSGDAGRAARLGALATQAGYPVRIRGLHKGVRIDEMRRVTSVRRALSTATDLDAVRRVITDEAQIILSNTSDAGFRPQPADSAAAFDPAMSYPAKLTHLLRDRFHAGAAPIQVMPTELIQNNGDVLAGLVARVAEGMEPGFRAWLRDEVVWVNSLVDRIVSEPLEPAGAVAEPYALWAIEARPGLTLPCAHEAIQVVPDLAAVERLKLFILNLGHTWMVAEWMAGGRQSAEFVRHVLADPARRDGLEALYHEEVLPAFAQAGEGAAAEAYIATVLERFANPFLDHRLADIAQNHPEKRVRRIGAFLDWASAQGDTTPKPRLHAALAD